MLRSGDVLAGAGRRAGHRRSRSGSGRPADDGGGWGRADLPDQAGRRARPSGHAARLRRRRLQPRAPPASPAAQSRRLPQRAHGVPLVPHRDRRAGQPVQPAEHRPAAAHSEPVLPDADRGPDGAVRLHRPVPARDVPPGADRHPPRGRQGDRRRQGGRRPLAEPLPRAQAVPERDGRYAAQRPALRRRTGHRQDVPREGHGPRGRRSVPVRQRHVVPVHVLRRDGEEDPLLLQGPAQGRPRGGRRDRLHRGDRRDRDGPRRPQRHRDARRGTDDHAHELRRSGPVPRPAWWSARRR
jgi:hypothetical protein